MGFAQGIYEESETAKERVGTMRETQDGRLFVYSRAGTSALSAGKLNFAPQSNASVVNILQSAAGTDIDKGDRSIAASIVAPGTAIAADYFKGGIVSINDATGEGVQYEIDSSTAIATDGTSVNIAIADRIIESLDATSELSIFPNRNMAVVESATEENLPAGVAPIDVTKSYYFWDQTRGIATVWTEGGAPPIGAMVFPGASAGSVASEDTPTFLNPPIGVVAFTAGVDTEYKPIKLMID